MLPTRSFYDPLYDVVAFKRRFWDSADPVTDKFEEILRTYEFNRLSFLRHEGVGWLAFPSASYTRFMSALGCWFLADLALERVQVEPRAARGDGSPWLGDSLKEEGLGEEFRLAVLLHDIGHFPFSHSLENNDTLKARYAENDATKGISLRHEDFTVSLIKGDRNDPIFNLYREFLQKKFHRDFRKGACNGRLISDLLESNEIPDVERDWIVYLMDPSKRKEVPDRATATHVDGRKERLAGLARHFVRGLIDLGSMDRASRASYFICGGGDLVHTRRILHNILLKLNEGEEAGRIILFDEGPRDAVDAIYAVKHVLSRYVFHDSTRLGYEAMLNYAINTAWERGVADAHFCACFPFMDDEEFLMNMWQWEDEDVQNVLTRIRVGEPYASVGEFTVRDFRMGEGANRGTHNEIRKHRRDALTKKLEGRYPNGECLLRLSETFGNPRREEIGQEERKTQRARWMDPSDLFAVDQITDVTEKGKEPVQLSNWPGVPQELIRLVNGYDDNQRRTFWLFVRDSSQYDEAVEFAESELNAEPQSLSPRTGVRPRA